MPDLWSKSENKSSSSSSRSRSDSVSGLVLPSPNPSLSKAQVELSVRIGASVVACSSSSGAGCGGGAGQSEQKGEEGHKEVVIPGPETSLNLNNNNQDKEESGGEQGNPNSWSINNRICTKMFTCRVLLVLLLVKCLVLSFIIPAHLIPTGDEYPIPHDYDGDAHNGEDGFDNNILDDQPLSLTLKNEILNLVDPFDIPSQPTLSPVEGTNGNGMEHPTEESNAIDGANGNGHSNGNGNGNGGGDGGGDDDAKHGNGNGAEATEPPATADSDSDNAEAPSENGAEDSNKDSENGGSTNGADDGEAEPSEGEDAGEAGESDAEATTSSSSSEKGNGDAESCSSHGANGNGDATMQTVLEKIENLMDAVKNIDTSIDKMETLVQSTMIDERVYKCMSAITNGNQTQALKYWKQILRYLSTPQKQAAILNQLIRDSYGGSEEQILPVIQFIEQTTQYYGYHTLFKELPKYNHLYRNTAIFTIGHHIKKACGRDSALYKSLPVAVQSVFGDFFTLQNKHNKGYLYYAKRCVAKHYFHCLDVLTKRIDQYVLDGLADDSEEKRRYHWKLNATDSSVTKFYILNHDKYWTYRLQDLNNSPRFKMEEAGSNADIELAHFMLKLNSDDELMIQVRDSDDFLEEEDFKSDKAEVRLHSFHQADGIPDSPRMFWLVSPVNNGADSVSEPESCNIDLAAVTSNNGNGSSK